MTNFRGLSWGMVRAMKTLDTRRPEGRLARKCLDSNVSVAVIAATLGVAPQTMYNWFQGRCEPDAAHRDRILEVLRTWDTFDWAAAA